MLTTSIVGIECTDRSIIIVLCVFSHSGLNACVLTDIYNVLVCPLLYNMYKPVLCADTDRRMNRFMSACFSLSAYWS